TTQDHDGGGAHPKSEGYHLLNVRGRELAEVNAARVDSIIERIVWREKAARRGEKVGRGHGGPIGHFLFSTVDRKICRRRGVWSTVEQAIAGADEAHEI